MAFDLSSAKEVGFDLSTASEKAGSTEDQEYLDYVTKQKSLSSRAQIPRFAGDTGEEFPILSREDWKKKKDEDFTKAGIEGLKGIGETALSLGTGAVAPFLAPAHMGLDRLLGGKKDYADALDTFTYTPRGEVGSKYVGSIGAALQALPPVGAYVNAPGMIRQGRKAPKPVVEPKPIPPVQEEMPKVGKSIDDIPQEVKDQQSFYNKQGEFFDLESAKPVDEAPINRGDLSLQEGLPFTDSVEAVREAQVRGQPQRDMFVEEGQLQRSFDPYQENLRKQADQERMDLERVAEESRKQQEIDYAFVQRQKDLFDEEQWRKHSDTADALSRVEEKLMAQERPSTFRRNELGAIDVQSIKDGIEAFKTGNKTAYDLLGAWRGAFEDNEWAKVYTALNDPKSKDTVALMSPAQFHALAAGRAPSEINKWGPRLYPDIEQGLASKGGLWEMPFLRIDKDGQVTAHEGRHRMDRFRERGLEMVPVRLHGIEWGSEQHPTRLFSQDSKDASREVKMAFSQPMPKVLTKGVNDPKLMLGPRPGERPRILGGMGRSQRGAVDLKAMLETIETTARVFGRLPQNKEIFSKEAILNEARRQDISEQERNVINQILESVPGNKITAEELVVKWSEITEPDVLSRRQTGEHAGYGLNEIGRDKLTGSPSTNIYGFTDGRDVGSNNHFDDPSYYGHSRIFYENNVRHVVELQSDLIQREKLILSQEEKLKLEENIELSKQEKEMLSEAISKDLREAAEAARRLPTGPANTPERLANYKKRLTNHIVLLDKFFSHRGEVELDRHLIFGSKFVKEFGEKGHRKWALPDLKTELEQKSKDRGFHSLIDGIDPEIVFDTIKEHNAKGSFTGTEQKLLFSFVNSYVRLLEMELNVNIQEASSKLKKSVVDADLTSITKNWPQRLIREELSNATKFGEKSVRFADADTVAKVERWPTPTDRLRHSQRYYRVGEPEWENLERRIKEVEAEGVKFDPEYQGIYNRYKKEITKYLESIGGKHVVDDKGFGWIEVPTEGRRAVQLYGQRGVIDLNAISEGISKLARLGKDAPEIVKATGDVATDTKREVVYNSIPGLDAFRPIWTPEKVIAAAAQPENFRDLTSVEKQLAKTVKPGIRTVRVSSNNPLINLMGETYSKMFSAAEEMARTYITNNDGIGPVWQKLSNDEKMQIHKLLKQGDNEQRRFTTAELDEAGYTKEQQLFMAKFYDMDAAELDLWNEKRLSIGMDPVKERPGHFRSVFKGDYWALAMENDDKGVPRVVGFVGNNTKWGFNKVKEQMQKENPGITFTEMKRRGLGGSYRRTDLAQGMADIMDFMAKNDPRIAEIRDAIKQVTDQHADGWLGAAEHALKKKGIWGNEGNKPWSKDAYQAADEAMKAYFTSWEEAVLSHHHLEANATFTALDKNEAVRAAWPNALDYVNKYSKSMTGNYTSTLGVGLNNLLDWGTQALTFNNLGPTVTRESVNQFTKRMGQLTQGLGNIAYTGMQIIQPLSTAAPEMMRVGGMADASKSSLKGIEAGFKYVRRALDPDFVVDADTSAMFAYAEDRGLLTFSEFDDVSKVTQGKVARTVDQAIDFNRVAGEISTRPTVFFTFVDMLKDMGLAKEEIFDTAYNLTQYSMTDYSPAERALMYRDLGVLGQLAGSLSQFKHSYVNQVSQWVGDSFKNPKTALVGLTMMATLAGYRGLPGYDDLDAIVKYITNKFGDKQMSINDIIASNAPEWFNSETPWAFDQENTTFGDYLGFGGLSGAAGVNLSSRLGSAQLLPESPAEAVSPYMGKAVQIGKAASELGTNPRAPTNLALNAAPSSVRGPLENKLATSESGMLINKEGQNEYQRTKDDIFWRKFGLTSLEESKNRDGVYQSTAKRLADEKRRSDISHEVNMKFNQIGSHYLQSPGFKKLQEEYIKRKGDPETLINNAIKYKQESRKTGKQRAEGEASGFSGAQRYKYYNP